MVGNREQSVNDIFMKLEIHGQIKIPEKAKRINIKEDERRHLSEDGCFSFVVIWCMMEENKRGENNMSGTEIINDIYNNVINLLKSEEAQIPTTAIMAAVGGTSPLSAIALETIKKISEVSDSIRLNMMLKGLAIGLNEETRLNELYNYVNTPERAFHVSNLFRQTLLSQSPIVCSIYGVILSEHVDSDSNLDYEDLIVLNALQTATDFEIRYMDDIFRNYILDGFIADEKMKKDGKCYDMVIEWGINNRVLQMQGGREVDGITTISGSPAINRCSTKLQGYINKARQYFRYS